MIKKSLPIWLEVARMAPLPTVGLVEPNHHVQRDVVLVADAVLEVLLLAGREPRLFRFVCDFKALWDDLFLDEDLHGEVKVASIIDLNPFLDDAGVNRVFTGFDLAAERNVEPHVHVLVGSEVNGDEVRIAAVGDGVIPSSIFRIVLSVLFDVSGVDNLPRRRPRACIARVRDSRLKNTEASPFTGPTWPSGLSSPVPSLSEMTSTRIPNVR